MRSLLCVLATILHLGRSCALELYHNATTSNNEVFSGRRVLPKGEEIVVGDITSKGQCYHVRGVPKSGTTWLTVLLEEMQKRNCRKSNQALSRLCETENPCQPPNKEKHHIDLASVKGAGGISVFIFRDTRDVLCSHYHWARNGEANLSTFASNDQYGARQIIRDQNDFLKITDKLLPESHVEVFYETLKANTFREAVRIASEIGMTLSREDVNRAINASSFDSMRKAEESGELKLRVHPNSAQKLQGAANKGKAADDLFGVMTRKGEVGGWRGELDEGTKVLMMKEMGQNLDKRLAKRFLEQPHPARRKGKKSLGPRRRAV